MKALMPAMPPPNVQIFTSIARLGEYLFEDWAIPTPVPALGAKRLPAAASFQGAHVPTEL